LRVVPETWRTGALNTGVAVTAARDVGVFAAAAVKKAFAVLTAAEVVRVLTVVVVNAGLTIVRTGVGLFPRTLA